MNDPVLLPALIEGTASLISGEGQDIALIRLPEYEDDGAGGQVLTDAEPETLEPVRRFFSDVTSEEVFTITIEGERIEAMHVLIGMPGDHFEQGDTFTLTGDSRTFRVVWVDAVQTYQVKARVASSA